MRKGPETRKSAADLLHCSDQGGSRMRWHRLLWLDKVADPSCFNNMQQVCEFDEANTLDANFHQAGKIHIFGQVYVVSGCVYLSEPREVRFVRVSPGKVGCAAR